jgi:hypothetical protein
MKSLSVGAFAVAALFCITPVSPHWSQARAPLLRSHPLMLLI